MNWNTRRVGGAGTTFRTSHREKGEVAAGRHSTLAERKANNLRPRGVLVQPLRCTPGSRVCRIEMKYERDDGLARTLVH